MPVDTGTFNNGPSNAPAPLSSPLATVTTAAVVVGPCEPVDVERDDDPPQPVVEIAIALVTAAAATTARAPIRGGRRGR
jgi:hypothetical protein